ncbi:MAG TPA: hypothetical protein PLH27_02725 [bacterium]|nr:hypothetical protein [bacterium]HNF86683.1 hypothetical protein [bacterium]
MKNSIIVAGMIFFLISCGQEKKHMSIKEFPVAVDSIFQKSCAIAGCHLPDEHDLAKALHLPNNLDLSSWSGLFEGGENGAAVVAYRADKSHMMGHIRGVMDPRMPPNYAPYNKDTLVASDVAIIQSWIEDGAPSLEGNIPFEHVRNKIFTTNQINDIVSVLDARTHNIMRVFDVGDRPQNESPHGIEVSRDGKYFYTSMIATGDVFKYDAKTGELIDKAALLDPVALIKLSQDGSKLYVTTKFEVNNTGNNGRITVLNTETMSEIKSIPVGVSPHGINLSKDGTLLYVSAVYSDRIYVINTQADTLATHFDVADDVTPTPKYEPYHIGMGPKNNSGYENLLFITCRKNAQVRIFQRTKTNNGNTFTFKQAINVGHNTNAKPIQLDVLPDGSAVFVANSNDSSITVIKKNAEGYYKETDITAQTSDDGKTFHRLAQPNGVSVSPDGSLVYVSNRNKDGAIIPHHGGSGGTGLITVIDVSTNKILKTLEVDPDAYSVFVSYPR